MYHADLAYWEPDNPRLRTVGWLSKDEPFSRGPVSRELFEKLAGLLANAWQPYAMAGRHRCPFCRFSGGPATIRVRDVEVVLGDSIAFTPGESGVYVCPSLIIHYMDAHNYAPAEEFQKAVLECPEMRSAAYFRKLRAHGVSIQRRS